MHDTPCKNCCFAEYAENTQVGCELNMIERYHDKGVEIIEAYDDDKEFTVLKDKTCAFGRKKAWRARHSDQSIEQLKKLVRLELMLKCDAVVVVENDTEWRDVAKTLTSLQNNLLRPCNIICVQKTGAKLQPINYRLWCNDNLSIEWRLELVVNNDETFDRCVDLGVKKAVGSHYVVCRAGYELPPDFLSNIDIAINDNLDSLIAILPDDEGNGFFVQKFLHKQQRGNSGKSLVDKLKDIISEDEECRYLVKENHCLV